MPPKIQPATAAELAALRRQLTGPGRNITSSRVIDAMLHVPRHAFVPAGLRPAAYDDGPLPIGYGQTISQPYIVAFMTEAIDPRPGDRVLEVGAGCGYQTAVLAELAGEVFALEIVPALAAEAADRLQALGCRNAQVRLGDGWRGLPDHAPFDAILIACAPDRIPEALLDQLKPGGRMVLPVGRQSGNQELVLIEKTPSGLRRQTLLPVRFVPMTSLRP